MSAVSDPHARAIITTGQRLAITPRGITIALVTALVESSMLNYANLKDAASLALPHDAVGSDGMSVGVFQQQNFAEWGSLACRMDPGCAAGTFYDHMLHPGKYDLPIPDLDYNSPAYTPGQVAQNVQRSDFPTRYDQRFAEATALYNRLVNTVSNQPDFNEYPNWSSNNESRENTTIDLWLIHTQEGDGDADSLAQFLRSTEGTDNPRSYHYTISEDPGDHGVTVVDVVDTDDAAWAVGASNLRSINLCFAGSAAAWTREQWMAQSVAIDVAAYLCVQDCIKYGITPKVIAPPYGSSSPPGISDHKYCTQYLKDGNSHLDVGDNFPWDVLATAIAKWYVALHNSAPPIPVVPTPPPVPVPPPVDLEQEIWDQLRLRWNMLGGHTLVEAIAAIRDKVCGTSDADKPGTASAKEPDRA